MTLNTGGNPSIENKFKKKQKTLGAEKEDPT